MKVALLLAVVCALAAPLAANAESKVPLHRAICHLHHQCPSDHHTYPWGPKRLYCTSYAAERYPNDRTRVVYGGRVYWCHR